MGRNRLAQRVLSDQTHLRPQGVAHVVDITRFKFCAMRVLGEGDNLSIGRVLAEGMVFTAVQGQVLNRLYVPSHPSSLWSFLVSYQPMTTAIWSTPPDHAPPTFRPRALFVSYTITTCCRSPERLHSFTIKSGR